MVKLKKGLLVITLVSLIMLTIRPFSIYASTTGTQITFTNNSSYTGNIWCYREQLSAYVPTNSSNYQYSLYFQTDPGLYGYIQGYVGATNESFSVAVQNGISETFYSTSISAPTLNYVRLIEYDKTIPQEVIDYIKNLDENVELTKDLLDRLILMRQWNIPMESIPWHNFMLNKGFNIYHFQNLYDYQFPNYIIRQNNILYEAYPSTNQSQNAYSFTFIFYIHGFLNANNLNTYFSLSDGSISNMYIYQYYFDTDTWSVVRFNVSGFTSNNRFNLKYINSTNRQFIPIYAGYTKANNISTDFALQFGLSNQLLDDLHIIAQGTQQSNSSASNLESSTSSFSSTASDVYNVEDQVSSGFSSSMQNIPSSFNFQNNFGTSFVVSASWVRDQFNNMTANNPFGSLITFSLILGVALLIIGRLLT